jgi:hypothetical protein
MNGSMKHFDNLPLGALVRAKCGLEANDPYDAWGMKAAFVPRNGEPITGLLWLPDAEQNENTPYAWQRGFSGTVLEVANHLQAYANPKMSKLFKSLEDLMNSGLVGVVSMQESAILAIAVNPRGQPEEHVFCSFDGYVRKFSKNGPLYSGVCALFQEIVIVPAHEEPGLLLR